MLSSIAVISYSINAAAFIVLSILFLTSWRGRLHGIALTVSCLLTAIWAATIAFQTSLAPPISLLTDILEIFRNAGWTIFFIMLIGHYPQTGFPSPLKLRPYVVAILAFYLLLTFWTVYSYWLPEFASRSTVFATGIVGRVAQAVIGMLLVEQLYRNTPIKNRWGIKFACLGIGGMFAYDFYLYSDALLFRNVNEEIWAARGVVNALAVPLVALSAARNPQWSLEISVSRRILFHTAALFGSATYLLVMAAVGYYLRFFGGSWGAVLQVAFLFGAVFLLLGILFSGIFRSWLKVFISKNFYSYNYDYREEWLRFTRTLAQEGYGLGERAIQAVAELVESPGGALFMCRDSGNCELVTRWNMSLAIGSEPLNSIFCQYLENKQWVIDIQEYSANPEKYESIPMPHWLRNYPLAWLIVPLVLHGKLLGFVVLVHPRSKIKLNWEVIDLLKIAGSQAASFLAQQESDNALMIARQFESFNRMSTFVVHDLKNLVSQLSLLLSNAAKHKDNPEFQKDMIDTVDLSIQKMKRLLEKLSSGNSVEKPVPFRIEDLLQKAVAAKSTAEPKPKLEILHHGMEVLANWASLERVIGHLIQNAIEATPKDGQIVVSLDKGDGTVIIAIKDTGHGMSAEFMNERLFKPFESTKIAGMGIGVFESHEYARELGGRLEVVSSNENGTTFRMILPSHHQKHEDVQTH
ncbi:MAG: PEP-CTERM system histidine kinase PrsK [Nitrosomonadales bacterium]|nr:PEP-CTERM system histidine kinase PrsK [Nitrosomonadales bacterium]